MCSVSYHNLLQALYPIKRRIFIVLAGKKGRFENTSYDAAHHDELRPEVWSK
jgi:hypothetical protein